MTNVNDNENENENENKNENENENENENDQCSIFNLLTKLLLFQKKSSTQSISFVRNEKLPVTYKTNFTTAMTSIIF